MALVTIRRSPSVQTPRKTDEEDKQSENIDDDTGNRTSRSLNECYFANKGAALVLGGAERGCAERRSPARPQPQPQPDIQHHLQAMFYLLRPEETLKMAVKLESAHAGRTRYLVVVCREQEAALLGIDCNECTTVGLVLRVLADTAIKLDGDGGFSVCVCNQQHIFKPVSVQAMWSALQTLHRASGRARELNHFAGGPSHTWCAYYESHVDSDRSCLNEWHAMDCIESRRPPSPDSLRLKPRQRDETERVIRSKLKEIMMSVDLDEVTSKAIRGRLEDDLDMDLGEYKSFIDEEMLTILGQMDAPTEVFDHVYLGSEWNASNLEELQRNGVRHILNVTREIDNFFPGMFDYLNIRVYDDDKTDLLKHWDNTFKYINKARNEGSKVLVHCKMGISRSASVVIAYAMKAFNWNFDKALKHVKNKRSCIKPNTNFLSQLETYQGILDAMKNKEKLQRSKSETNLKSPKSVSKAESKAMEPTRLVFGVRVGGGCAVGAGATGRPRSWSPDTTTAASLLPPTSVSLENLAAETRHMLMPCANGSYSVSPNQIIRLKEERAPCVKHIVNEIENIASSDRGTIRRNQRLNFGPPDPSRTESAAPQAEAGRLPQLSPARSPSHKSPQPNYEADRIHTWDPGEHAPNTGRAAVARSLSDSDDIIVKSECGILDVKNKLSDDLYNCVERIADIERRGAEEEGTLTSRHSPSGLSESCLRAEDSGRADRGAGSARPPPDIAANERKFNETCAILKELASAADSSSVANRRGAATWGGRVWASAPADTWRRAGRGARRRLAAASHGDLPRAAPAHPHPAAASAAGLVSNLKKEFEARSEADARRAVSRVRAPDGEDLSVRVLVGRYDQPRARTESAGERPRSTIHPHSHSFSDSHSKKCKLEGERSPLGARRPAPHPLRNSFCGAGGGGAGVGGSERPPPAPTVLSLAPLDYTNVVVSTVMSKAQNKKQLQHGKTHPLTKLNINRSNNRCSNPVYNTM